MITDSPAYRANGLIVITFDESGSDGNVEGLLRRGRRAWVRRPVASEPERARALRARGGGRVGAVLLSKYIRPGTVTKHPYNHYSMLRSVEDLFGLSHIGDAKMSQVRPFGADVYTRPQG